MPTSDDDVELLHARLIGYYGDPRFYDMLLELPQYERYRLQQRDSKGQLVHPRQRMVSRDHPIYRHAAWHGGDMVWVGKLDSGGYPLLWLPEREFTERYYVRQEDGRLVERTETYVDPGRYVYARRYVFLTLAGENPNAFPSRRMEQRPWNRSIQTERYRVTCGVRACVRADHIERAYLRSRAQEEEQ